MVTQTAAVSGGIKTKFGEVDARSTMPVMGMRTLILIAPVPMIPAGAVLHRTRRHEADGTYDVFKNGLWDAVSGLTRAEKRATVMSEMPDLTLSRRAVYGALMHLKQYRVLGKKVESKIAELTTEVGKNLEHVENHEKVIARTQIMRAAHITDRIGRVNPGRSAALLVAGNTHLWKRIMQIGRIYPILNADVLAITSLIEEYDMLFDVVGDAIEQWRKRVLDKRELSSDEQNEFCFSMNAASQALHGICGAPHSALAGRLLRTLELRGVPTHSVTREKMKVILEDAFQASRAPRRLRRVMELNVESGLLEKAPVSQAQFLAHAVSLRDATISAMWEFMKSVPNEKKVIFRAALEDLKRTFEAGLKQPKRTWLHGTRDAVRDATRLAS